MKTYIVRIAARMFSKKSGERGMALVVVMLFVGIMSVSLMSLAVMVQRDMYLVERIKSNDQARFLAEAGVNYALADIKANGFPARHDLDGNLDTGSYSVQYSTVGGRELITSLGTASGVSSTVLVEIRDNTPTAMNYFSGAGNDININALIAGATITGDIHANNNVYLKAGPIIARLDITGKVSATGIVKEGWRYDEKDSYFWFFSLDYTVFINEGFWDDTDVFEGEPRITFPTFDYGNYRQAAIDSGDYYGSDTVFTNATLTPANGIVFVDGDVEFWGNCVINGGIIADSILIRNTSILPGRLTQNKVLSRNVIISRNGDIKVWGRFTVNEALVFASQDIISLEVLARLDIKGIFLAGRNVNMWNFITVID